MSNQILEFAGGAGANTQDYATYYADSQREVGNQPGLARSILVNKVLNQTSKMSTVLAQFIDDYAGDVLDTDSSATILASFITALEAKINEVGDDILPTGTILAWSTETPPTGFLECDGSSLLRATYADLFAIIGTDYGYADATHFNLPDYRGEFLRGWAHGDTADPDRATRTDRGDGVVGDHVGTKQDDMYGSHYHYMAADENVSEIYSTYNYLAAQGTYLGDNKYILNSTSTTPTVLRTQSKGSNQTAPQNVNVMFCIKY